MTKTSSSRCSVGRRERIGCPCAVAHDPHRSFRLDPRTRSRRNRSEYPCESPSTSRSDRVSPVVTDHCDGSHDTQTFPAVRWAPRPPDLPGGHVHVSELVSCPRTQGTQTRGASPQGEQVAGMIHSQLPILRSQLTLPRIHSCEPSSQGVADECNHWRNTTRRFSGS